MEKYCRYILTKPSNSGPVYYCTSPLCPNGENKYLGDQGVFKPPRYVQEYCCGKTNHKTCELYPNSYQEELKSCCLKQPRSAKFCPECGTKLP